MTLKKQITQATWAILLGVIGFFLWGLFFPLAQGLVVEGEVVVVGKNQQIQHPQGGSVKKISMTMGQHVEEGQVLLELKDYDNQFTLNAAFSEKKGLIQSQNEIDANVLLMADQLQLAKQRLDSMQKLVDEEFYSANHLLEIQQKINEYQSGLNDRIIAQQKNRSRLEELEEKIMSLQNSILEFKVRSPAKGVIKNLNVFSLGQVVKPGEVVAEITPDDAQFEVQAKIPVGLIDKLENNSSVEVTFPHLQKSISPRIYGELYFVSPDKESPEGEPPYFIGKVRLISDNYEKEGIKFGMPCQVFIQSEDRTFFNYIFKPITDNFGKSFKN